MGQYKSIKKNKIHVVLSDQPFDPFVAKDFAKLVLAYCKKNSIKKFFMVSGIENLNKNPKTTKVYGLVTHQILEKILYNNIIPKFINGSILGSDAAIISVFRKSSVPALILYSECHPYFPDPDAAISAINILAKILKIKTNKADIQKSMEYLRIQNRNLMADTIKALQQEKSQKVRTPHIYR